MLFKIMQGEIKVFIYNNGVGLLIFLYLMNGKCRGELLMQSVLREAFVCPHLEDDRQGVLVPNAVRKPKMRSTRDTTWARSIR